MKLKLLIIAIIAGIIPLMAGAQIYVDNDDIEERDGTYYYNDILFTGEGVGMTESTNDYTKITYDNGAKTGFYGYYDEPRTVLKWFVPCENNQWEGIYTHFQKDGSTLFTVETHKGKLHGVRHCFYSNTNELMHIHHYKNGDEHGKLTSYYKNGLPYEVTRYKRGKMHGTYKRYYQSGALSHTGHHHKGEQSGTWKEFDENGQLIRKERKQ